MFEFSCFFPQNVADISEREGGGGGGGGGGERDRVVVGGALANDSNGNFYILSDSDTGMDQTAAADYDEQTEHVAFLTLFALFSTLATVCTAILFYDYYFLGRRKECS